MFWAYNICILFTNTTCIITICFEILVGLGCTGRLRARASAAPWKSAKGSVGLSRLSAAKIHWITHLLDSPHNHLRVVKPGWILAGSSGKHRQVENPFKSHWQGCSHGNEQGLFHVIWRWISSPEKNVSCSMAWEVYIRYQIPLHSAQYIKNIYIYFMDLLLHRTSSREVVGLTT